MADEAQTEFALEPDELTEPRYNGKQTGTPPPPTGRPKGAKNKLHRADPVWKLARSWTPSIVKEICERAARLSDEIDFKCAQLILSRTWRPPRSAPIQIDITQVSPVAVLTAMAAGELTPSDAATLVRAIEGHQSNGNGAMVTAQDARSQLAERLERMIEARAAEAEADGGPSATIVADEPEGALTSKPPDDDAAADSEPMSIEEMERIVTQLEEQWPMK